MKRMSILKLHLPGVALAIMAGYVGAQQASMPAVKTQLTTMQATVQSVDPAARAVTVLGKNGPMEIFVGSEVKNFNNIHVGDKVNISFYQGLAAQIAKGGQTVDDPAAAAFAYRDPKAGKPGGGLGASVTVTVKIEAVDTAANTVTFKRSDGTVHIITVQAANMQAFIRTLKKGDEVNVTYTESVAINVVPATSPASGRQ